MDDLHVALAELGLPAILKTAGFGYDGKGQVMIRDLSEAPSAFASMNGAESVLEEFIDFECELSVVAARGVDGNYADYGAVRNVHARHILDITTAPAEIDEQLNREAADIARGVLEKLDVVGVLCVEFFLTKSGKLLINELAPRPHNSGHFTFDACVTSQFEQQLRAVCGLPLGSTDRYKPAAMVNLLGDLWRSGEPHWAKACAFPNVKLHLYGKLEPRPGRKMGHLTALADTAAEARAAALAARRALTAR
jgi:5-(carboxyamino)imidazole ribonucleotide synthase